MCYNAAGAVDLGAMWIHEAGPGNAVYDLAERLGVNISKQQDYSSAGLFNPDGSVTNIMLYMVRVRAHLVFIHA